MRQATLLAVPADWSKIASVINPLAGPAFSSILHGNTPAAFDAVKGTDDPLVVLIGGAGSHEVLQDVLDWKHKDGQKRVRWVHSYMTGIDGFNVSALRNHFDGVPLTNARGCYSPMLAEHVILSVLYFNRQVWRLQANRKTRTYADRFPSVPGTDQRMGIIGYGDIGREVAKRSIAALGVKVTGLKHRKPESAVDDVGVQLLHGDGGLRELLATSDIVVTILPNTPATKHFITAKHFAAMKPSALFINIGRGATVIEDDLVDAVQKGTISGTALDVFETEPLPPTSRLWELEDHQLLLSPHIADVSTHSHADSAIDFVEKALRYANSGELPEYRIDFDRGY
jgi:phosphoglycerate dehydrogenase-like enzyme